MRLTLAAVGRGGNAAEQALCEAHLKHARTLGARLGFSPIDLAIADTARAAGAAARLDWEAERLGRRLPPGTHRIALDEAGRARTSQGFAAHLAHLRDSGLRDVAFLIGGPDGLAPFLREGAEERLAFGPQTWPHLLVRAMLAEQIYRAFSILSGHPYHRGGRR